MRRSLLCLALAMLVAPATTQAQISLLAGAGLTNPLNDLNDVADAGWHAMGGVGLRVSGLPVGLRADGAYHALGENSTDPRMKVLSGALSVVGMLPGVGLRPYLLGGFGVYRRSVDAEGVEPVSDGGIHGAFGVEIGGELGFAGFAEVRYVSVRTDSPGNMRFVTATLGVRL